MKVKIDFCDFWPGFNKTNNFFANLLRQRFEVEICDSPNFIIYADPGQHAHRVHNCVKIYWDQEVSLPDFRECDYALSCHYLRDPRHLRLPFYVFSGEPRAALPVRDDAAEALAQKTRFCSFVVSNHHPRKNKNRSDFFQQLSQYKQVDSGGKFLNNIGGPIPGGPPGKLAFLRHYKFNIAFENALVPGYTTEKIVQAMQARCLPIYWGNPRVAEEFNPASFLNYSDFPSSEALIERIIELDKDDAKYLEITRQPCFPNNERTEYYREDRLLDFFEKVFSTPIRPVSTRRSFFRLGRWIAVKQNRPHGP